LLGPVLLPDRRYTLVVRGAILDAEGRPMGKDFTKSFRTTAEDRERIKVEDWKHTPPTAGTREPLTLQLPKSIDHRSLGRFLAVADESAKPVAGTIEIGKEEKSWLFRPAQPWSQQEYRVRVDPRMEDVAGNSPLRPFDVDLKAGPPPLPRLHIEFRPSAAGPR
jgi:hypothetical protein